MLRIQIVLLAVALAACGCEPGTETTPRPVPSEGTPANNPTKTPVDQMPEVAPPADKTPAEKTPASDNSAINERDRSGVSKTPIDQSEKPEDIQVTSDIRKRVMEQPEFTLDAQNIKIITADGKVTLRGPVKTLAERETIEKIAHEIAGPDNVDNQLEIAPRRL